MKIKPLLSATLVLLALGTAATSNASGSRYRNTSSTRNILIPAGTAINVRLDSNISTDTSKPGDVWTGTVSQSVVSSASATTIPQGSPVEGVVTNTSQGTHSTKAQLALAMRQVTVNGRVMGVNAATQPIVAGTARAKKLGVIAGSAAAGALLGHTVAKDSHGTLIGGLVGGAAGYGLTRHAFRTMQLKPGTELTFTMRENLIARAY
jgi:hypothetical protein